jgi:hypothetical protein
MRLLTLATMFVLLSAAAGCGWAPYPTANATSTGAHGPAHCGRKASVQCLLDEIRPTTGKAQLHRIFRKLRRLGVQCTGDTGPRGISCTGPGAGEGWQLGFATAGG